MVYPKAFVEFLMYFHGNRDYFECHEVLEEYWKEADPKNRTSHWVGLIQVAVGFYHYRRGNLAGAVRTFNKAINNIELNQKELEKLGIASIDLKEKLLEITYEINHGHHYQSIILPLTDDTLIDQVQDLCKKMVIHGVHQVTCQIQDSFTDIPFETGLK